jgi:hypothetical protein
MWDCVRGAFQPFLSRSWGNWSGLQIYKEFVERFEIEIFWPALHGATVHI